MSSSDAMAVAAKEILEKGQPILSMIDPLDYAAKVPEAFDSSIGAHFRHCLDHFQNLLDSLESGTVDYDSRQRDPLIENDPSAALAKTSELLARLDQIGDHLPEAVQVRCKVSYSCEETTPVPSTPARELMFCVSHAIHHHAMIRMIGAMRGIDLFGTMGVAPSTVAHRLQTASAPGA